MITSEVDECRLIEIVQRFDCLEALFEKSDIDHIERIRLKAALDLCREDMNAMQDLIRRAS